MTNGKGATGGHLQLSAEADKIMKAVKVILGIIVAAGLPSEVSLFLQPYCDVLVEIFQLVDPEEKEKRIAELVENQKYLFGTSTEVVALRKELDEQTDKLAQLTDAITDLQNDNAQLTNRMIFLISRW